METKISKCVSKLGGIVKLRMGRCAVICIELIEPQSCCIERLKAKLRIGMAVKIVWDDDSIVAFSLSIMDCSCFCLGIGDKTE